MGCVVLLGLNAYCVCVCCMQLSATFAPWFVRVNKFLIDRGFAKHNNEFQPPSLLLSLAGCHAQRMHTDFDEVKVRYTYARTHTDTDTYTGWRIR